MFDPEKRLGANNETSWRDKPYWSDKGNPCECFDVFFGDRKIEVVNFSGVEIKEDQLEELRRIISEFSQIRDGQVFDKVKSIFVDNEQPIDPETEDPINGMGEEKDGIVKLYPQALKPVQHRVEGVSNFSGTLVHELSHGLITHNSEVQREWAEEFGWSVSGEKVRKRDRLGLSKDLMETPQKDWGTLSPDIWKIARVWEVDKPERCVTDYARLAPNEDFCESMVAALRNPEKLDMRRLRYLKEIFLYDIDGKTAPEVDIQKRI